MAGEFNLYSQYAQTQAPISQFVPEKLPWELIYQVGANKQAMQDKGVALKNAMELAGSARYVEDAKYLKSKNDAVKQLSDEYAGKEMTGHVIEEMLGKFKQLKDDSGLATIAARTAEYDKAMKTLDEYSKDPNKYNKALEYADFRKKEAAYNKSGAFDASGNLTNVNIRAGVHQNDELKKYFEDLKANGYETPAKMQDLMYTIKTEGIDSPRIAEAAKAALHNIYSTRVGEQIAAEYDMIKDDNPDAFKYKDKEGKVKEHTLNEYTLDKLMSVGSEFMYNKQGLEGYASAFNELAKRAYDKKEIEDGVIRQPGNLTQGVDFQGLDDLDEQIAKETDSSKKTTLQNTRAKAMAEFGKTEEGKQAIANLDNFKKKSAVAYLTEVRTQIDDSSKEWLKSKGINIDNFARISASEILSANNAQELNNLHNNGASMYLNKDASFKKLSKEDQVKANQILSMAHFRSVNAVDTESKDFISPGSLYKAFDNYNSAFTKSMAGKTFSVGDVLTHANTTIQEKTDKQFKQGYEVSDFSVIGSESGSDEEKNILDAIHQSTSVTVKPVDNSETNTPEIEVTYDDPVTGETITHRILAKDNRSVGLYHTMLKNYGDTGKNVSDRLQHASFVPPIGKAISLQDHGYSDVNKAYTAMTNKDGSTMTLYKDSKPVNFETYLFTLNDNAANAALTNEIYKHYGKIFSSINDPRLQNIINTDDPKKLSAQKYNGVSDQDIYVTVAKQPYEFNASVDLIKTAQKLK